MSKLDELEASVEKMRALGVKKWGDIELDDPPPRPAKEETKDEALERLVRERQKHLDILFAASPAKPRLTKVK